MSDVSCKKKKLAKGCNEDSPARSHSGRVECQLLVSCAPWGSYSLLWTSVSSYIKKGITLLLQGFNERTFVRQFTMPYTITALSDALKIVAVILVLNAY